MILIEKLQQVSHQSPNPTEDPIVKSLNKQSKPTVVKKSVGSGKSDGSHTPGGRTLPIFRFGDVFFKSFFTSYNVS
jgi:hypothetical protein